MVDEAAGLSVRRQCELLGVSRSRYYRPCAGESEENLRIMERMDRLHLEDPSAGARRLARYLRREGLGPVGRRRVRRLMGVMQMEAIYQRPRTSRPGPAERAERHPYLLSNMTIDRPNQVWCSDITYVPMERGYMYIVAILDWYSRRVLAWELSNTLDAGFCLRALRRAVAVAGGPPEVMNTDQGCQFTGGEWLGLLREHGIRISMDGKGRWRDNVVVERFWRTLKYDHIYLWRHADGESLRKGVAGFIERYNTRRPHSALGDATPDEAWRGAPLGRAA